MGAAFSWAKCRNSRPYSIPASFRRLRGVRFFTRGGEIFFHNFTSNSCNAEATADGAEIPALFATLHFQVIFTARTLQQQVPASERFDIQSGFEVLASPLTSPRNLAA
ncbi:MAG TPA: hypothetical protein VGN93_13680 [Shinella sp.]|jgi:hypothetical protein|uniref:hypothetical protein n=1 Tax=Shinella sp. TaxID=1870904 RepID=UPI002E15B714|nr:hypothetical protein [Shinella sp.]